MSSIAILFVCLGNICRSPTAEAVFRAKVVSAQLDRSVAIASAGTYGGHAGQPPDPRAQAHASRRGYDLSSLRARAVERQDFDRFDLIFAADGWNLARLESMAPRARRARIVRMLDFAADPALRALGDVPDPYTGQARDFEHALDLIEAACEGLLAHVAASFGAARESR